MNVLYHKVHSNWRRVLSRRRPWQRRQVLGGLRQCANTRRPLAASTAYATSSRAPHADRLACCAVTDASSNVAVGLPDVGAKTAVATYRDTEVRGTTASVPVTEVVDRVTAGTDFARTVRHSSTNHQCAWHAPVSASADMHCHVGMAMSAKCVCAVVAGSQWCIE
jgi:hypothetical protein